MVISRQILYFFGCELIREYSHHYTTICALLFHRDINSIYSLRLKKKNNEEERVIKMCGALSKRKEWNLNS